MKQKPRQILVRGVNWIGDAIIALPALHALRGLFPESRITLLMKEPIDRLFAADPALDSVIGFTVGKGMRGLLDRLQLVRRLRREDFDLCLVLPNSWDSALVPFLAGIPERIGFDRNGRGVLLTKKIPADFKDRGKHQAGHYLKLVQSLGPVRESDNFHLELEPSARRWAEDRLSSFTRRNTAPLIGFHPGATYGPAKMWFPERFTALGNRLRRELKAGIVIMGGPGEIALCGNVAAGIPGGVLDLSGQTDLPQLAAILSCLDLLITNDSGPMHLASATGTPVVALFGSTNPNATSPMGEHRIIRREMACAPCLKRVCPRGDTPCMKQISVDEVFDTTVRFLRERQEKKRV